MNDSEDPFHGDVPMPWDDATDIYVEGDSQGGKMMNRWSYIKMQLNGSKQISNIWDLIEAMKSYNVTRDGSGKQVKPPWKFSALVQYIEKSMSENERNEFFKDAGILATIRNLSLQACQIVPKVKLLKSGVRSSLTLHQLQIASLLANAFLCTYPVRDADYPSINFNKLFEGTDNGNVKPFIEKIKCIVHYFKRIYEKQPAGKVSFHRLCIHDHKLPRWDKTTASLCGLRVQIQGKIEDQEGFLQMDFANRFVGGGVLGRGCVQEEIRFIICPELIIARLFTQCLADNEALFVVGAERYCKYVGYADTFQFDGDYRDATPFDETGHRKTYLIVLDALYFSHSSEQYRESKILRELKKAYVGFKPIPKTCALPLATGNWGCGAFRGDPQLKSILQLMASSQARRDVLYLTFGDSSLKKQIDDLYKLLKERDINVGTLYRIVRLYKRNKNKNQTLFEFIRDAIVNYKKRANFGRSSLQGFVRKDPFKPEGGHANHSQKKFLSELDDDCGNVETGIKRFSVSTRSEDGCRKGFPPSESGQEEEEEEETFTSSRFPSDGTSTTKTDKSNLDEYEGSPRDRIADTGPRSDVRESANGDDDDDDDDEEMPRVPSPSLLSDVDVSSWGSERRKCAFACAEDCDGREETALGSSTGQRHKIYANPFGDVKAKARKLIQPKITDCFFKK